MPEKINRMIAESVVISGLSGRLPDSDTITEFADNLFSSIDMVTEDHRRWTPGCFNLPLRNGKLKDLTKFDAAFFGVHPKQANRMDPQLRLLLEVAYEAIIDSGTTPEHVRGSRTGVFIGCSASECHDAWSNDSESISGYEMTGCTRSMFANRLSYFFDFKGPSYAIDTACSSSLLALDQALQSIKSGVCDAAIVGGTSLCLKPQTSLQFQRLSMLSADGACKSFDASGNGYCRSEAVVVVYLQKQVDAKRIYATLIHSKNNTDGFKEQGITFPSGAMQKRLLEDVYSEAQIDPSIVAYVELHGTGTAVGDPQEANSVADVFCRDRAGPLLIGSTKSNMGHPEPASGLAALTKVLIAMERGSIPPNLHYSKPNPDIPALSDGRLQVVDKVTNWQGGYVGINSFGFGGSNVHVLLHGGVHQTEISKVTSPARIITCGGRTKEAVERILNYVNIHPSDCNLQALIGQTFSQLPLTTHPYRGWTINNSTSDINIEECKSGKRPIWLIFAGMGTQWDGMGKDLLCLPAFDASIQRSDAVLRPHGIQLYEMISNPQKEAFNDTLHSFVGIAAIQVALVDLLRSIGIEGEGFVGHSVGELGCAYADGALTSEETVLAAYWRGRCVTEGNLAPGAMAAIGLTWEEARLRCVDGVVPACHNSRDTVTITGMEKAVHSMVDQLQQEGIFARMVKSAGVAFHSNHMQQIAPSLKEKLENVIKENRRRTSRWISSSIPESEWNSELASFSSPAYHVNNLLSPVLFYEALQKVPNNAITIEVSSHCLLQAILKRTLSQDCTFVGLMHREQKNNLEFFFKSIGRLYENGVMMDTSKIYGEVDFPVPQGTPMLSPLLEWDHSQTWDVPTLEDFMCGPNKGGSQAVFEIDLEEDSEYSFLAGHKIDGRVLFPATGYLVLAWQTLARLLQKEQNQLAVIFNDFQIHSATIMPVQGIVRFEVTLSLVSGHFDISESDILVASGKIKPWQEELFDLDQRKLEDNLELLSKDVYKELHLRGYQYKQDFKGVQSASKNGACGVLMWRHNWITFLDTMLQFQLLSSHGRELRLPTRIQQISIDPSRHLQHTYLLSEEMSVCNVFMDTIIDSCQSGAVEMIGLNASVAPKRPNNQALPILESYDFVPRFCDSTLSEHVKQLLEYTCICNSLSNECINKLITLNTKLNFDESEFLLINKEYLSKDLEVDKTIYKRYLEDFTKEKLLNYDDLNLMAYNYIQQLNHFKVLLNIATENIFSQSINIFESEADVEGAFKLISKSLSSEPALSVNYFVVKSEKEISDNFLMIHLLDKNPLLEQPNLKSIKQYDLIVLSHCLHKKHNINASLEQIKHILKPGGFILIIESVKYFSYASCLNFKNLTEIKSIWAKIEDGCERTFGSFSDDAMWIKHFESCNLSLVSNVFDGIMTQAFLLRVCINIPRSINTKVSFQSYKEFPTNFCKLYGTNLIVFVSLDDKFRWVDTIKSSLEDESIEKIWICSSHLLSGIVGMVNCLRREPDGQKIRCALLDVCNDDETLNLLSDIQHLDLVMNVYKEGKWGTFKHLPLKISETVYTSMAFVNVLTRGDLSSLRWIESPLKYHVPEDSTELELYKVAYTSLNFRDIMLATGKLPPDAIPGDLASQECLLGMEFSGFNSNGERVMGLLQAKGLATHVLTSRAFTWNVAQNWSLEEAATIPVAYATAYYALVVRGGIKKGDSVLIHSGSGAVGQAAISIALSWGCKVFTTVGSKSKQEYLMKRFTELTNNSFANSRDSNFWRQLLLANNGRRMDVVLNSLADDKLISSVRLIAKHGRFLEIGKYDLSNDSKLGMSIFLRNISFHGILLDALFDASDSAASADWMRVHQLLQQGIQDGVVKPLQATVFGQDQIEEGFRFMAQGKHIGKVVVKISDRIDEKNISLVNAISRSYCDPTKSYLIVGGLGGFGLELADWLITRGCRHLVLTSRRGVNTGYQIRCLQRWNKLGVNVVTSTQNAALESDAKELIDLCVKQAPLAAIFNLAMILIDASFVNQTANQFATVAEAKVSSTLNLDILSRKLSLKLDWFVVFSSVSCGRGNPGQSNYAFANSAMERICEARRADALHGLAIQWGAVGDVGVVADTMSNIDDDDIVIGGTLPQKIQSCLAALDTFLSATNHHAVVSSYVVATLRGNKDGKDDAKSDLMGSVAKILGIKDVSKINVSHTLGDLGLDSLMGVEIKQTLERDFDVTVEVKQIRNLTFNDIKNFSEIKSPQKSEPNSDNLASALVDHLYNLKDVLSTNPVISFNTQEYMDKTPLFVLPPIEGSTVMLHPLLQRLHTTVHALQYDANLQLDSIEKMAEYYSGIISSINKNGPINLAGYSFGACIAIQIAIAKKFDIKKLILLDGSHKFVSMFIDVHKEGFLANKWDNMSVETQSEMAVLNTFLEMILKRLHEIEIGTDIAQILFKLQSIPSFNLKLKSLSESICKGDTEKESQIQKLGKCFYQKLKAADSYKINEGTRIQNIEVCLIRASGSSSKSDDDYGLRELCSDNITIKVVAGFHQNFFTLENESVICEIINNIIYSN